jgi:hypothetical protein
MDNDIFDKKLTVAWLSIYRKHANKYDSYTPLNFSTFLKISSFIMIVLFSFGANASYCVKAMNNGNLRIDAQSVENCTTGMILLSKTEYQAINVDSIVATLIGLFEFSVEDFALFNAICLIGFISGHALGRVGRLLGKV